VSMPPRIDNSSAINEISALYEYHQRKVFRLQGIIASLDDIGRLGPSLHADLTACQLSAIKPYLREKEWDPDGLKLAISAGVDELRKDYLFNYKELLKAREGFSTPDGKVIDLNKETRREFRTIFKEKLDRNLQEDALDVDAVTDLNLLELRLEDQYRMHQDRFVELFEKKQEYTFKELEKRKVIEPLLQKLRQEKQELRVRVATDIFTACQLGDNKLLKQLIKKEWFYNRKKFVNQFYKSELARFTPLQCSSFHSHRHCVDTLLSYGADPTLPDRYGYLAIHWAAKQGDISSMKLLLKHAPTTIHVKAEYGRTPLHLAAYNGRIMATQLLLDSGANINAKEEDPSQYTALHWAVIHKDLAMVETLASYPQLDLKIVDADGRTALYYAVMQGDIKIVASLLKHYPVLGDENPNSPEMLLSYVGSEEHEIPNRETIKELLNEAISDHS